MNIQTEYALLAIANVAAAAATAAVSTRRSNTMMAKAQSATKPEKGATPNPVLLSARKILWSLCFVFGLAFSA